jgi:hypothetical protein
VCGSDVNVPITLVPVGLEQPLHANGD